MTSRPYGKKITDGPTNKPTDTRTRQPPDGHDGSYKVTLPIRAIHCRCVNFGKKWHGTPKLLFSYFSCYKQKIFYWDLIGQ